MRSFRRARLRQNHESSLHFFPYNHKVERIPSYSVVFFFFFEQFVEDWGSFCKHSVQFTSIGFPSPKI